LSKVSLISLVIFPAKIYNGNHILYVDTNHRAIEIFIPFIVHEMGKKKELSIETRVVIVALHKEGYSTQ